MKTHTKATASSGATDQMLSTLQVAELLGVSRFTVSRWHNEPGNDFPKPARLAANCLRWRLGDIEAWVQSRVDDGTTDVPVLSRPMPEVRR